MLPLKIGKQTLAWGTRTYVMGILNLTPDSFSGDGLLTASTGQDAAMDQARRFIESGVDILDVGGESTRPGSQPVDAQTECQRVIPIIQQIASEFPEMLISVDTYKASVAEEALQAGARIVNDVWSLRADPDLVRVVARYKAPIILMHNRSKPANADVQANLGGRYIGMQYTNLLEDVKNELLESVDLALAAGIPSGNIILDPGIGFGKTVEQNLELLNRLGEVRQLGYPVLLGPSRKSFIGYTLDMPPDQRLEGTAAAVSVGIVRGADIIRVHDVEFMSRVARMTDAIIGKH
ncbi:MAG: dihydropteroate synthase [Chloroflexota bacterium]